MKNALDLQVVRTMENVPGRPCAAQFCPDSSVACVATAEGTVHVYSLTAERMEDVGCASASQPVLAFSPDSSLLAIAASDGVRVLRVPADRTGWASAWSAAVLLPRPHITTAMAWSDKQGFLAITGKGRTFSVYSFHDGTLTLVMDGIVPTVFEGEEPRYSSVALPTASPVTGLAWTPSGSACVFADATGHVGTIKTSILPWKTSALSDEPSQSSMEADMPMSQDMPGLEDEEQAADDSQESAAKGPDMNADKAKPKEETKARGYLDAEAHESSSQPSEGEAEISLAKEKARLGFVEGEEDGEEGGGLRRIDADEDDEDKGAVVDMEVVQAMVQRRVNVAMERAAETAVAHVKETFGLVPPQAAFQPGSTHFKEMQGRGVAKRYLVWNGSGSVTTRQEALANYIDIEYTESSRYAAKHLDDNVGFSMAALTVHGVVLASKYKPPAASSEPGQPATLLYKAFSTGLTAGADFRRDFPVTDPRRPEEELPKRRVQDPVMKSKGEEEDGAGVVETTEVDTRDVAESPVAVTLGDGWLAVATDAQELHFIRTCGGEDAILHVPGDVVAMAASGMLCAVVYNGSAPMGDRQQQFVHVYRVQDATLASSRCAPGQVPPSALLPKLVAKLDMPLKRSETLQWVNFASNGMLCAHTSGGSLWCLSAAAGWQWVKMLDTRQAALKAAGLTAAKAHTSTPVAYWPVEVRILPQNRLTEQSDFSRMTDSVAILRAVFVRGAVLEPPVTNPRPLAVELPLKAPVLSDSAVGVYDSAMINNELLRTQRMWCAGEGLLAEQAAVSMEVEAVNSAAVAVLRGDTKEATEGYALHMDDSASQELAECAAADKATIKAIRAACQSDQDALAMQLLQRLHTTLAIEVTRTYVKSKPAVAERAMQLYLIRKAQDDGELPNPCYPMQGGVSSAPEPVVRPAAPQQGFGLGSGASATAPVSKPLPSVLAQSTSSAANIVVPQRAAGGGTNPFAKKAVPSSPTALGKRGAAGLDVLGMASPEKSVPTTGPKFAGLPNKRPKA